MSEQTIRQTQDVVEEMKQERMMDKEERINKFQTDISPNETYLFFLFLYSFYFFILFISLFFASDVIKCSRLGIVYGTL